MSDHNRRDRGRQDWYTHARRFRKLIGKTPDGARIWGGPYTYTQFFGAVAVLVVGAKTVGLWGQFGVIGNAVLLLGAGVRHRGGAGRLPIGSRNPLAVTAGVLRASSCPPVGRRAGRPVKLRRPHRARGHRTVSTHPPRTRSRPPPRPGSDRRAGRASAAG